ncbi:hypothetical protein [Erwinia aphidicola]|uniref:hypothetical protein n=1 Tax=Erwinia aphidicola TaxID=68334 RepID=UPI0030CF1904
MDAHFLVAANKVLEMYESRRELAKYDLANSISEYKWASEMLSTLAGVAAYTGCLSAVMIHAAAKEWGRSGLRPSYFNLPEEGDKP